MSEWRETVLGDLCERVTVGHVGKMSNQYVDTGVPFLRSQNVQPFFIERTGMLFIDEGFNHRLRKSALSKGDVVVVRTGYPGTAAVIPCDLDGANCADLVVITPSALLNPHFLAAIFNSVWGKATVSSHLVGSAQQHFNVGSAKSLQLRVPNRQCQDEIADVLCAFTDLIENNRRRVELLESMARAIYREWFVHFRFPGHENVTMVDSALGPIPEGWKIRSLFEVADVGFGYSFKSKCFGSEGPYAVIRIRDVLTGATATYSDERPDRRYQVVDDDLLIGMDGEFHMALWRGGEAWLNQRVTRIRPTTGHSPLMLMLAIEEQVKTWNRAIVGTTVAHLGKRHLEQIEVVVPPARILGFASSVFDDLMSQRRVLSHLITELVRQRDLLLPKLVSGEIDVSSLDVDSVMSEAVA